MSQFNGSGLGVTVLLQGPFSKDLRRRCLDSLGAESALSLQIVEDLPLVDFIDGLESAYCAVITRAAVLPDTLLSMIEVMTVDPQTAVVAGCCFPLNDRAETDLLAARTATLEHEARARQFTTALQIAAFPETFGIYVFRSAALRDAKKHGTASIHQLALTVARTADLEIMSRPVGARLPTNVPAWRRLWTALVRLQTLEGSANDPDLISQVKALTRVSGLPTIAELLAPLSSWRRTLRWRFVIPLQEAFYERLVGALHDWPIGVLPIPGRRPGKLAYYLWRYPTLSETFIRREINAILAAGTAIEVIADEPEPDQPAAAFVDQRAPVRYLGPVVVNRRRLAFEVAGRPFRSLHLLLYVLGKQYGPSKALRNDIALFRRVIALASEVRDAGVTHLHSPWGSTTAFIAMVAARFAGVPFSVQFRAHDIHRHTAAFLLAEKMSQAQFVVTNTDFNLHFLQQKQTRPTPIHRIYNGLPLDSFDPTTRRATTGRPRILSVARLIEPKGLIYLLQACAELRRQGFDFQCTIVGGPELPTYASDVVEIKGLHRRLGLEDCVDLAGPLPFAEVLDHYRQSDLFVLPCVRARDGSNDITPNAVLEAMAMALPVVSTHQTAIPELLEDGVSGLLVEPRNVDALVHAIVRLLQDGELRERLGRAARQHIEERFDGRRNVEAYVRLFSTS